MLIFWGLGCIFGSMKNNAATAEIATITAKTIIFWFSLINEYLIAIYFLF